MKVQRISFDGVSSSRCLKGRLKFFMRLLCALFEVRRDRFHSLVFGSGVFDSVARLVESFSAQARVEFCKTWPDSATL